MPLRFKTRSFSASSYGSTSSLTGVIVALVLLLIGGFVVYVATTDLAPPTQRIEKVIPDERLR